MEKPVRIPLAHVADLLLDAICVVDAEGRYLYVSAAYERIFGYAPAEVLGRRMIELVHPDDRQRTLRAAEEIMGGHPKLHFQNRYVRKDGQVVHVMWSARWSEADQARIAVARDITELKRAEALQTALYAISEAAFAAKDLLALFQRIHRIVGGLLPANNFFVALRDDDGKELDFPYFVDEHDVRPEPQPLDSDALSAQVVRTGEALLLTPDNRAQVLAPGRRVVGRAALDWLGVPLRTPRGVIGALAVQTYAGDVRYTERDKTLLQFVSTQVAAAIERKQVEARLQHVAQHDPLTDLPNRELFHDRLDVALARARRESRPLALLYIDLDRFKRVNDDYGHDAGDRLLREVAARLRQCVREADTVGRLGGDEFAVLLGDLRLPEDATHVAGKIRQALHHPYALGEHRLHVAASIGIAFHPSHGEDREQLIRCADDAMYRAKKLGGDRSLTGTLAGVS
jgi:diguanylate cyclase (GGDEF)-like protein/PAS domain S-box-containing protein